MASHTRFPGVKTPNGVYGAQYQHPPHLMQNPVGVGNVMPSSVIAPPNMTATSVYGVQPGHQGIVTQVPGMYSRQVAANPATISAMQKQMKQKELEHQQQQEKMKKEYLFQEQKQRLKTMTGPNKGKQLSVDALMDSYLKPSALKPHPPTSWHTSDGGGGAVTSTGPAPWQNHNNNDGPSRGSGHQSNPYPPEAGFKAWQDRDVPENYVQIYQSTLNAGGLIDTSLLYPVLLTSGLPRELLGHVWSLANQSIPGQLSKAELFFALAMIGFIQSGNNPSDLSLFCQAPRPFPVILSLPAAGAPPGAAVPQQQPPPQQQQPLQQPQQLQHQPASVSFCAPVSALSAPSMNPVSSMPASSLHFSSASVAAAASAAATSSSLCGNVSSSHLIIAQHSSLCLNSNPQQSFASSQQFPGSSSRGPQSLTSAFSQDSPLPAPSSTTTTPSQPSEPANHQHHHQQQQQQQQPQQQPQQQHPNAFPLASWETSSTASSVLAPTASNVGFSASAAELRGGVCSLSQTPSSLSVASTAMSSSAAASSFAASPASSTFSFPPVFPVTASSQMPPAAPLLPPSHSDPLAPVASRAPPEVAASAISHPPILPTPLSAADAGDKYAAFKDLRAPEEEDDFADFVAAEVKEPEAAPPPAAQSGVFAPPQPAPVLPVKSVSATEKIIENLNNFSISSKSRKSSSEEPAAFNSAENVAAVAAASATGESWADFSQCFDQNPAVASQQQQQQQQQQGSLTQHYPVASRASSEPLAQIPAPEEFGDFTTSLHSGPQLTAQMAAPQLVRPLPAAAPAPPPMSDGYHFSDPFFSPDNGLDAAPTGFANFNSKESTPVSDAAAVAKSALSSTAPYLDAVAANGGASRGSSIAAETQSVSSLELPAPTCATSQSDSDSLNGQSTENNSVTSDDPGSGLGGVNGIHGALNGVSNAPQQNGFGEDYGSGPRRISASGLTSKQPLFGDRYSAVIEDVSASECLPRKWVECLQSCHRMIAAANTNLSNLTSAAACLEFITAKKGLEYLTGIVEIYRVACRIFTSMKTLGIVNKELGETMRDIEIVWQNLTTFLAKSPSIMPEPGALDFGNCVVRKPGSHADAPVDKLCGVCLLNVEGRSKAANPVTGDAFKLAYGGRQYHASCANLWVNCVNPILPALVLPSPFM